MERFKEREKEGRDRIKVNLVGKAKKKENRRKVRTNGRKEKDNTLKER